METDTYSRECVKGMCDSSGLPCLYCGSGTGCKASSHSWFVFRRCGVDCQHFGMLENISEQCSQILCLGKKEL